MTLTRAARRHERHRTRVARARWTVVGVTGELLVTAGVLILLFVAWQLWWTDVESNRAAAREVSALQRAFAAPADPADPADGGGPAPDPRAHGGLIEGRAFALMHIPRLGTDWSRPVLEGTDRQTLTTGLGHYVGTAAPGEVGNFAVAGHRTTYGRPFHDIETLTAGDTIVVETREGYAVYAVTGHRIVLPSQGEVIAPVPGEKGAAPTEAMLTLTACHPKFSAAQRYVVHAALRESFTRAEGLPASILAAPGGA